MDAKGSSKVNMGKINRKVKQLLLRLQRQKMFYIVLKALIEWVKARSYGVSLCAHLYSSVCDLN